MVSSSEISLQSSIARLWLPVFCMPSYVLLLIGGDVAMANGLVPPPYEVMNRHGVNMASGQVSPTLVDVSIGNQNHGLSHSISSTSSNFVNYWWESTSGVVGFRDKFFGAVLKSVHHKPPGLSNAPPDTWVYVMRAFDTGGSFDFIIRSDGTYASYNGDPRHTLVFVPSVGFVWTKPDGTTATFGNSAASYDARGVDGLNQGSYLSEIKSPDGFTIKTFGGEIAAGVTTNTGYQLKYVYVRNDTPVDNDDPSNTRIPPAGSVGWSQQTPKYVVAINNAVDYCEKGDISFHSGVADACPGLSRSWPIVTYNWPNGMPRAMFLNEGSFTVTDAQGGVTEYIHRPFVKPTEAGDPQYRIPRIVAIRSSRSITPVIHYDYTTKLVNGGVNDSGAGAFWPWYVAGPVATLSRSSIGSDSMGYDIAHAWQYPGSVVNGSGGAKAIASVIVPSLLFGISEVNSWHMSATLEQSYSNRLTSTYDTIGGIVTRLGYDSRGNINSITKNDEVVQTASYPASCDNRKTCNQASWIKDAKGNQTDFEYDPNSGATSRVRMPPDANGVRPEVRYTYQPKYAFYKNVTGSITSADSPIYLLVRERKCLQGATLADGSGCVAGAADEVVTDYDYGADGSPNNLNLRGTAVTAYVNGTPQTRRACYSYDDYGNRIGETTPRAGVASCY